MFLHFGTDMWEKKWLGTQRQKDLRRMQQGYEERKRETREREVENKKNAVGVTTNRLTKRKFGCNKITYNNTLK